MKLLTKTLMIDSHWRGKYQKEQLVPPWGDGVLEAACHLCCSWHLCSYLVTCFKYLLQFSFLSSFPSMHVRFLLSIVWWDTGEHSRRLQECGTTTYPGHHDWGHRWPHSHQEWAVSQLLCLQFICIKLAEALPLQGMDRQAVRELELGSTKGLNHIFHLLYFGADRYDDPAGVKPGRCTLGHSA